MIRPHQRRLLFSYLANGRRAPRQARSRRRRSGILGRRQRPHSRRRETGRGRPPAPGATDGRPLLSPSFRGWLGRLSANARRQGADGGKAETRPDVAAPAAPRWRHRDFRDGHPAPRDPAALPDQPGHRIVGRRRVHERAPPGPLQHAGLGAPLFSRHVTSRGCRALHARSAARAVGSRIGRR